MPLCAKGKLDVPGYRAGKVGGLGLSSAMFLSFRREGGYSEGSKRVITSLIIGYTCESTTSLFSYPFYGFFPQVLKDGDFVCVIEAT
jgi:hypothetical protein